MPNTHVRDLRRSSLSDTYIAVHKTIVQGKSGNLNLSAIIENTKYDDAFDESLKLIIIQKGKLRDCLEKLIFTNRKDVLRMVSGCQWFFEITPNNTFIKQMLPVVSYSARCKLISALAQHASEDRILELYLFVRQQYGARQAEPLFARLPKEELMQRLVDRKLKNIAPRTFITIIDRFPDLGSSMMKRCLANNWHVPHLVKKKVLLADFDSISTLSSDEINRIGAVFGRKAFRSIMLSRLESIDSVCYQLAKRALVLRHLKYDQVIEYCVGKFWIHYAPGTLYLFSYEEMLLLQDLSYLSLIKREQLLEKLFNLELSLNLWETPDAWSPELLEVVTAERRSACLAHERCQGGQYIYLRQPSQSIPMLIANLMQASDQKSRKALVKSMIKSCKLVHDFNPIKSVLEVILEKLSTDARLHYYVLRECLGVNAGRHNPDLWPPLLRIVKRAGLMQETTTLSCYYEYWVEHLFLTKQDTSAAIEEWLNSIDSNGQGGLIGEKNQCAHFLLKAFYNALPGVISRSKLDDPDHAATILLKFLNSLNDYNFDLCAFSDGGVAVLTMIEDIQWDHYSCTSIISLIRRHKNLRQLYGNNLKMLFAQHGYLAELLHADPAWLCDNIDSVISHCYSQFRWSNKHSHLFKFQHLLAFYGLRETIACTCDKLMRDGNGKDVLILEIYSHVLSCDKFVNRVQPYLESGRSLNKTSSHAHLTVLIPKLFRSVSPLQQTLPYILPCLVGGGDFLYPALSTFLKYCYNAPVQEATIVCIPLLQSPVSVMKKVVRIISDLCTLVESFKVFKDEWDRSKHYSARSVLATCMAKIFIENPCEETWLTYQKIVLYCLSDPLLITVVPPVSSIPDHFVSEFVDLVWSNCSDEVYSITFIEAASSFVSQIDDTVCRKVIEESFLLKPCYSFFASYILDGAAPLDERISFVLRIFRSRVDENFPAVSKLFDVFRKSVFHNQQNKLAALPFLHAILPELKRIELFTEWLQCAYLSLFLKRNGDADQFMNFGKDVADLWLQIEDYALLQPILIESLDLFIDQNENKLSFLVGFVSSDPLICLSVLDKLHKKKYSPEILKTYPDTSQIPWDGTKRDVEVSSIQFLLSSINLVGNPLVKDHLSSFFTKENCTKKC